MAQLAKKKFRLTVDFEFTVEDLTDKIIEKDLKKYSDFEEIKNDPQIWGEAHRERRLLRALVKDKPALAAYMTNYLVSIVGDQLEEIDLDEWIAYEGNNWEILRPVVGKLSQEDREFFYSIEDGRIAAENTRHLSSLFDFVGVAAELSEIPSTEKQSDEMTAELQKKCLHWAFEQILENVWSDRDIDSRMATVLGRANVGHMILIGNESVKEEIWNALPANTKKQIRNMAPSMWSQYKAPEFETASKPEHH